MTHDIKRILYPVDFTESSVTIAPYVKSMANTFKAELHILYVTGSLDHYAAFYVPHPSLTSLEEAIIKGAEQKMEEFRMEHFEGDPLVRVKVLTGDVADGINKYAESEGMDLIIMATHGRTGLDRMIFGSVADKVVRTSKVPVLTVRP